MIIKESRKGIIKILGIFGDNVMGVNYISSPFMHMDYIFFVEKDLNSTKLAPILSCSCQVNLPFEYIAP